MARKRANTRQTASEKLGYVEKHHVIPRCLGGSNDQNNLVFLTAKEHYICHRLLTKMTIGKDRHRMVKAHYMMLIVTSAQRRHDVSARMFEQLRKNAAASQSALTKGQKVVSPETRKKISESTKGRPSPFKGRSLTDEQKMQISMVHKGKKIPNTTTAKILASRAWYRHSEETKAKISAGNTGKRKKSPSTETRELISLKLKGIKRSPETIEKLRKSTVNALKQTCVHCQKTMHPSHLSRWHGDNCKMKSQ